MKTFLIVGILLCLACVMACEDTAIGEYPITKVDDTVMVFPLPGDTYHIWLSQLSCDVTVFRPHDEQSTLTFSEHYWGEILSVLIVKRPTDQE